MGWFDKIRLGMREIYDDKEVRLSSSGTVPVDELSDGLGNSEVSDSELEAVTVSVETPETPVVEEAMSATDIGNLINAGSGFLSSLFSGLAARDKAKNTISYDVTGWGFALAAIALVVLVFKK